MISLRKIIVIYKCGIETCQVFKSFSGRGYIMGSLLSGKLKNLMCVGSFFMASTVCIGEYRAKSQVHSLASVTTTGETPNNISKPQKSLMPSNSTAPVKLKVDRKSYFAAHDPLWETLPMGAFDAPMIGTGASGTYLIQDKESGELRFDMSRNDLCHVRVDFAVRKPNGWFRLRLPGEKAVGQCRLDLFRAQIEAKLKSGNSTLKLSAFAVQERDVIVFDFESASDSTTIPDWDFVPDLRIPAGIACPTVPAGMKPYPPQTRLRMDECEVSVQELPVDVMYNTDKEPAPSQHATAWRIIREGNRTRIFSAVAMSYRTSTAARDAVDRVNKAFMAGFDSVWEEHQAWWRSYYEKSFVSLPPTFERWHCLQLYKIPSMSNAHSLADLCGPWFDINMLFNGIWLDWNTEAMYSSTFTTNHPGLSDIVLNFLWKHRENLYDKASDGYSVFWGPVSAHTSMCGYGTRYGLKTTDPGCLVWLLTLAYERYQCTMDPSMFLDKAVPLLVGAAKFYKKHLLFTGADGKLHMKAVCSPEFLYPRQKFEDTTFQLASFRWLCRTLITTYQRYGIPQEGVSEYQAMLEKLTPYCIDPQDGFMIGKNQPFSEAHRHNSHELAIWPYLEYLPSNPAHATIISNTIKKHKQMGFENNPGMADAAWALYSAMLGRGDDAAEMLASIFKNPWVSPKVTHCIQGEKGKLLGYCEEGPFFTDRAIQELLLQSWGDGIVRIFPAVPTGAEWKGVAFHDFLAKGAFLISAKKVDGITRFIQLKSLAGEPCKVQTNMAGKLSILSDCNATLTDRGQGLVQINGLGAGNWCVLYSGDRVPELTINGR